MANFEEWRTVQSNPDYEISNLGRVRSWLGPNQYTPRAEIPRILNPGIDGSGYRFVALNAKRKDLKRIVKVHRLVMDAFGPPCPQGCLAVNHINENKEDNSIENLEWVSNSGNMIHSFGSTISLRSPNQEVFTFPAIREAARVLGLDSAALIRLARGEYKQTKGWTLYG